MISNLVTTTIATAGALVVTIAAYLVTTYAYLPIALRRQQRAMKGNR